MLKRILFIALFIGASVCAFASSPRVDVDLNRIKIEVAQNPGEYQALMNRFLIGDTTLTLDQVAKIYYGYAFSYDYDPTDHNDAVTRAYDSRDYAETWRLCEDALRINPVSLDLTIKALVAANNGNDEKARKNISTLQNRYAMLTDLILASGKGTSPESPFIVICEDDMGRIVSNVICVESTTGRATVRDIDAIKVKLPTSSRQHILYFDNTIQKNYEREKARR